MHREQGAATVFGGEGDAPLPYPLITPARSWRERFASLQADVTPGDYVDVSVSDSGCGTTVETQAKAFEPFYTTKDVGKGSGLGLSMVYGFVKQSGGHVTISSCSKTRPRVSSCISVVMAE